MADQPAFGPSRALPVARAVASGHAAAHLPYGRGGVWSARPLVEAGRKVAQARDHAALRVRAGVHCCAHDAQAGRLARELLDAGPGGHNGDEDHILHRHAPLLELLRCGAAVRGAGPQGVSQPPPPRGAAACTPTSTAASAASGLLRVESSTKTVRSETSPGRMGSETRTRPAESTTVASTRGALSRQSSRSRCRLPAAEGKAAGAQGARGGGGGASAVQGIGRGGLPRRCAHPATSVRAIPHSLCDTSMVSPS